MVGLSSPLRHFCFFNWEGCPSWRKMGSKAKLTFASSHHQLQYLTCSRSSFIDPLRLCLTQGRSLLSEWVLTASSSVIPEDAEWSFSAFGKLQFTDFRPPRLHYRPSQSMLDLLATGSLLCSEPPLASPLLGYYFGAPPLDGASYLLLKLCFQERGKETEPLPHLE